MANRIDPLLYGSSLHSHSPNSQTYSKNGAQQHNGAAQQPYYLPATQPQPQQTAGALDPALAALSESPRDHSTDDDEDGQDGEPHDGSTAKSPGDAKRPRACDHCRQLKVKCTQEPGADCKRCLKGGKVCFTSPPIRKRTKKTDSKVAELEKRVDMLQTALLAKNNGGSFASPYTAPPTQNHGQWPGHDTHREFSGAPAAKRKRVEDTNGHQTTIPEDMDAIHRDMTENPDGNTQDTPWGVPKRGCRKGPHTDHSYINGLINDQMSPEVAEAVFARYVKDICPHFPAVPLAPGTTAAEVRRDKPLLFLAILAGSCHGSNEQIVSQDVQRNLTRLLKDQFADIIWRNGEKSLEIVQALHLGVLWYRPPLHYEQHNFYMMVNCAAVMALDLGLGRRTTPNVMKLGVAPFRRNSPNTSSIEARRTFLVCYYLCMSITMVLRRPILIKWTKYMQESMEILESSPEAYLSDRLLCQHVKMAHIGENISVAFSMDDPSTDIKVSDPRVIQALRVNEQELEALKNNRPIEAADPALHLAEHVTDLYIHEIALHHNQSPADFQPPFPNEAFAKPGNQEVTGPIHIGALGKCLTATHGILDTILGVPLGTLLTLPVIFCVRAIYAVVCLMKMWVAISSPGEMSMHFKKEDLKIEAYTESLVKMFNEIVRTDAQSPHGKFYYVAKRLQDKFVQIREGTAKGDLGGSSKEPRQTRNESQPRRRSPTEAPSDSANSLHILSNVAIDNDPQKWAGPQGFLPPPQSSQFLPPGTDYQSAWYSNAPGMPDTNASVAEDAWNWNYPDIDIIDTSFGDPALSGLLMLDGEQWGAFPDQPPFQGYNGGGAF